MAKISFRQGFRASLAVILTLTVHQVISRTNNPPLANTGAPNENNCTNCHAGSAVTSGTDFNNLELITDLSNNEYLPDSTYTFTVKYKESGTRKFGFMATALEDLNDSKSGSFTVTSSSRTAKGSTSINSSMREYIYHRSGGTTGTDSISWDFDWTAPSTNQGNVSVYVALNSSNNASNSSGDKIVLKDFQIRPSSDLPTAKINLGSNSICVGDTLSISGANSSKTNTYSWKIKGKVWTNSTSDSTIKGVWSKPGTFDIKLTTTNNLGNSIEDTVKIRVFPKLSESIEILGNDTICEGSSVELKAASAQSYEWSNNRNTRSIRVSKSGTYFANIESANGCKTETQSVEITVLPKEELSLKLLSNDTLCAGDSFKLAVTSGFASYNYFNSSFNLLNTDDSIVSLALKAGVYSINASAVTDFGCETKKSNGFDVVVVEQKEAPTMTCTNVGIEQLSSSWQNDTAFSSFEISLDSGATWLSPNESNKLGHTVNELTYNTEVSFWLRGKTNQACQYSKISTKTCKTKGCFKVDFNEIKEAVCANIDSGEVVLSDLNLERYAISFDGGPFVSDSVLRYKVSAYQVGENQVKVSFVDSNALSCPVFDTFITVMVLKEPEPVALTNWFLKENTNRICFNSASKLLEGNRGESGVTYVSWKWTGKGIRALSGNYYEFYPNQASVGRHLLEYEVENIEGCTSTIIDTIWVDTFKSVSFTFSQNQREVSFSGQIEGANNWLWEFGDGNIDSVVNPIHNYSADGDYTVTLSTTDSATSCANVSFTEQVSVLGAGIGALDSEFNIFPNPFNQTLNLQLPFSDDFEVEIINSNGVQVQRAKVIGDNNCTFNTNHLRAGIYLLRVKNADFIYTQMLVK